MPRGNSINKKLELLDLSKEDFDFYVSNFIQSKYPYNIKIKDQPWIKRCFYEKAAAIDDHAVLDHLCGKHWIATFSGTVTKYFCIDLDYSPDVEDRARKVFRAFPGGAVVFQSSKSKGLHVYYFLDQKITLTKLLRLINLRLDFFNIEVRPGFCEVFPQEKRALRLPLGKDSFLLNKGVFTPCHETLKDGIKILQSEIIYHSVKELFLPDEYFRKLPLLNRTPLTPQVTYRGVTCEENIEVKTNIVELNGLQKSIACNAMRTLRGKDFNNFINYVRRNGIELEGTRY